MKKNTEERKSRAKARVTKKPETETGFCQNCSNAPGRVRHGLRCAAVGSEFNGQYVPRKGTCGEFRTR